MCAVELSVFVVCVLCFCVLYVVCLVWALCQL